MNIMKYRCDKSYDWNYENAPEQLETQHSVSHSAAGQWDFLGRPVGTPLGIAAGPLLNGKWVLYYASLGFSVLTYKTVRSVARSCYPLPNLTPVSCQQLNGSECSVPESQSMESSWAVSFGMPSKDPAIWRSDIESTRNQLPSDKLLSVSVVGTMQPDWTIDDLARDYALCAKWATESGADCIETNFSCPNVSSCDGQLYQNAADAGQIAATVRSAIGNVPLLIKIGHFNELASSSQPSFELLKAVAGYVDGIVTTNSIATTVLGPDGQRLFDGQSRGICGDAIREESIRQTAALRTVINAEQLSLEVIGVGGIRSAEHVRQYLAAGAHSVQLATAAMQDPLVGQSICKTLGFAG